MLNPNDLKRVGRAVRATEKAGHLPANQDVRRGVIGTGDSREVHCAEDGGTDGNATTPTYASWTYTIKDGITGATLATHVRVVCQRLLATTTLTATAGTAVKITSASSPFYNSGIDGTTFPVWLLTRTDERYGQENDCVVGVGPDSSSGE